MTDWFSQDAAQKAFDFLQESEAEMAEAAGQLRQLDEGRKSILALIASKQNSGSEAERDRVARADNEYRLYLDGLGEAVRRYELLRAKRARAMATIDAWRTSEASRRGMGKVG